MGLSPSSRTLFAGPNTQAHHHVQTGQPTIGPRQVDFSPNSPTEAHSNRPSSRSPTARPDSAREARSRWPALSRVKHPQACTRSLRHPSHSRLAFPSNVHASSTPTIPACPIVQSPSMAISSSPFSSPRRSEAHLLQHLPACVSG